MNKQLQNNNRRNRSSSRPSQRNNGEPLRFESNRQRRNKTRRHKQLMIRRILVIIICILFLIGIILTGKLIWDHFKPADDTLSEDVSTSLDVEDEVSDTTTPTVPEDSNLEIETQEDTVISFLAVGDNLIHTRLYTYADTKSGTLDDGEYDFLPLYENVAEAIGAADISFVNQESIIGGDELGISGYPSFNTPEQMAADLSTLGFDIVNGANNHTLDMGLSGVNNTCEIWRQYDDILFGGIYDSQEDADTIRLMEYEGITFAFLSYTYGTNGYAMVTEYCTNLFDEDSIREDVAKAKEVSDVIIVSAHWGEEGYYQLNSMQTEYGQLFADLEVDLVIGTHSHTIQSLEWVEGVNGNQTLIAYGLGNFISTMETVDTQLAGMLTLDFVVDGDDVTIENVEWTALVNYFTGEVFSVGYLSDFTEEMNATHYVLATKCPDAITYFTDKTLEIIGTDFKINY